MMIVLQHLTKWPVASIHQIDLHLMIQSVHPEGVQIQIIHTNHLLLIHTLHLIRDQDHLSKWGKSVRVILINFNFSYLFLEFVDLSGLWLVCKIRIVLTVSGVSKNTNTVVCKLELELEVMKGKKSVLIQCKLAYPRLLFEIINWKLQVLSIWKWWVKTMVGFSPSINTSVARSSQYKSCYERCMHFQFFVISSNIFNAYFSDYVSTKDNKSYCNMELHHCISIWKEQNKVDSTRIPCM